MGKGERVISQDKYKKIVLFKFIKGIIKVSAQQRFFPFIWNYIRLDVLLISRMMELNLPEE